jgi:hypothetical protein
MRDEGALDLGGADEGGLVAIVRSQLRAGSSRSTLERDRIHSRSSTALRYMWAHWKRLRRNGQDRPSAVIACRKCTAVVAPFTRVRQSVRNRADPCLETISAMRRLRRQRKFRQEEAAAEWGCA